MDNLRIFPKSKKLIQQRIHFVEGKLRENTLELKRIAAEQDGDVMDDNNFRSLRTERELLEGELSDLKHLASSEIHTNTFLPDEVTLGCEVEVEIIYPDGEVDHCFFIISGAKEAKYLPQYLNEARNRMVISENAPISQSILGKEKGTITKFDAPEGHGKVKILNITQSDFLMSVEP